MRKNILPAFAFLLIVAAAGLGGCGLPGEPGPRPPIDKPIPDAEGRKSEVAKTYQTFNPLEDCPQPEDSPGPDTERIRTVTSGTKPESGQSMESKPYETIVAVNEYPPDGGDERNHIANGVLLGETGHVATSVDYSTYPRCLEVVLRDGTALPAMIRAVHADSGATILEAPQIGIPMGVSISASPIYAEAPVHMYGIRNGDSPSAVEAAAANAGNDVFWLLARSKELTAGDAIFDSDGALVGLLKAGRWQGATISLGGGGAPTRPDYPGLSGTRLAVKASVLEDLSEQEPDEGLLDVPVVFHFGEAGVGGAIWDSDPVALAEKADSYLSSLDTPAIIENLGGPAARIVGYGPGKWLELIYPASQSLESTGGKQLGYARYVMMWWRRGAEKPDVILAGPDSDRITHAFEVEGLGEFEALVRSRQSYYRPFMTPDSAGFPREYPARWSFTTDTSSYSPGETVRVSLRIENVSVLLLVVELPSPFWIRSDENCQAWDSEFASEGEYETILPGDMLVLTTEWDQVDREVRQASEGNYVITTLALAVCPRKHCG